MSLCKDYETAYIYNAIKHTSRKQKHSLKRKNEYKKQCSIKKAVNYGYLNPYYIVDEEPIYRIETVVIPESFQEEKCLYIVKNKGEYLYTDKNGNNHYGDLFEYRPTGRIIHYPEKTVKRKYYIGSKNIPAVIKRTSYSNLKQNIKKNTSRRLRHTTRLYQHGDYKKLYDRWCEY